MIGLLTTAEEAEQPAERVIVAPTTQFICGSEPQHHTDHYIDLFSSLRINATPL